MAVNANSISENIDCRCPRARSAVREIKGDYVCIKESLVMAKILKEQLKGCNVGVRKQCILEQETTPAGIRLPGRALQKSPCTAHSKQHTFCCALLLLLQLKLSKYPVSSKRRRIREIRDPRSFSGVSKKAGGLNLERFDVRDMSHLLRRDLSRSQK